jgi:hypothetical protein
MKTLTEKIRYLVSKIIGCDVIEYPSLHPKEAVKFSDGDRTSVEHVYSCLAEKSEKLMVINTKEYHEYYTVDLTDISHSFFEGFHCPYPIEKVCFSVWLNGVEHTYFLKNIDVNSLSYKFYKKIYLFCGFEKIQLSVYPEFPQDVKHNMMFVTLFLETMDGIKEQYVKIDENLEYQEAHDALILEFEEYIFPIFISKDADNKRMSIPSPRKLYDEITKLWPDSRMIHKGVFPILPYSIICSEPKAIIDIYYGDNTSFENDHVYTDKLKDMIREDYTVIVFCRKKLENITVNELRYALTNDKTRVHFIH